MPSLQKMLFFISSALVTAISIGVLGYGMSAQWAELSVECAKGGSNIFNGSALITLDLFSGFLDRTFCPQFGGAENFQGKFLRL